MKTVTIVGVGALGSHVAMLLRNDAKLRLIDFDRVEQKNVLSQFHSKPNVGKLKVSALQASMQFLWGVKPEAYPQKLVANNADVLLGDCDLIIDCLDNGEGRRLVRNWAMSWVGRNSKGEIDVEPFPCLHGALAADGAFGRAIWTEHFQIDDETDAGTATCEGGEHLPFVAITAAYIARMAQVFLKTGKKTGISVHGYGAIPT